MDNKKLYRTIRDKMGASYYVPVSFKDGNNYTIRDVEDKEYIDLSAGYAVANIGYNHPEMLLSQVKYLLKSNYAPTWMPTTESLELAEKLISYFPGYKCLRTTGGSNGNEVAISVFYNLCGGEIGTFERSYHGWSQTTLGMGEIDKFKLPNVRNEYVTKKLPPPNQHTLEDVEEFFIKNPLVKIFIAEPILGSGGVIIPEEGYWKSFQDICKKYNVFLIFDETITAFGRMGHMFATHYYGVEPDGLIFAKGMSSGYASIGAVLIKEVHLKSFKFGDVSATFAWTPFSCAVTTKNIEIIEKENLCNNSKIVGQYLKDELIRIFTKHCKKTKFEIRGIGMMVAIKFLTDNEKHNIFLVGRLVYEMIEEGVMFCYSGDNDSIIGLPPLTLDKEGVDKSIRLIENVLIRKDL
jgi:4-aminobutyrate aminotransferase-like enzyme